MERRTPWIHWSDDLVVRLVEGALPERRVVSVARFSEGRANSVFLASCADGSGVVVRASTRDPRSADKEFVLAALLHDEAWMPRLLTRLAYQEPGTSDDLVMVGLWEYVPAATLADAWPRLGSDSLLALARELGTVLARLRSFSYPAHGDLAVAGDSLTVSPWGFASGDEDERTAFVRWCLFDSPAGDRLGPTLRDRLWSYMQACAARWPTPPPVLVHADFGPSNLLVTDDGRLAAVLDWEFAHAGDPAADLGNLFRARPACAWPDGAEDALARSMRAAGVDLPSDWAVRAPRDRPHQCV